MYTEKQFRHKITTYSFCVILAVVMIHTYNLNVYHLSETSVGVDRFVYYFESIAASLWAIAVPMFFMISGFLMFRTFSWERLGDKYRTRFHTILIPYLLWNTIYYVYYIVVTRIPVFHRLMNGNDIAELSISEWIRRLWIDEYFVFWFLKDLLVLILFTPVLYVLLKNRGKWPVGIVMLLVSVWVGRHVSYWPFQICYLLGAYVGINYKSVPMMKKRQFVIAGWIGLLVWLILAILNVLHICNWNLPSWFVVCCFWYAGDLLSDYEKSPGWWMEISFFIYCLHDMILEAYEKIFFKIFGGQAICALLDYLLMPALTVLTVIAIAAFMRRYMPRPWKILTGNRGSV